MRRLLKKGACAAEGDYDRRTPLHLAAAGGHQRVAELLLAQPEQGGAGGRLSRSDGLASSSRGQRASRRAANVNAQDRWHCTPLADALRCGHTAMVRQSSALPP